MQHAVDAHQSNQTEQGVLNSSLHVLTKINFKVMVKIKVMMVVGAGITVILPLTLLPICLQERTLGADQEDQTISSLLTITEKP